MQHMKSLKTSTIAALNKLAFTGMLLIPLAACHGPTDVKLSEMNEPENTKKLLDTLKPDERLLLQEYVMNHTAARDIDYSKTVKEAIEAQRAESSAADKARANVNQIK